MSDVILQTLASVEFSNPLELRASDLTLTNPPSSGKDIAEGKVSGVTSNLKEAGCEEHTNSRENLWSDKQKSHMWRLSR